MCSLAQCSILYADGAPGGMAPAVIMERGTPAGGGRCGAVGVAAGTTASLVGCMVSFNSVGLAVAGGGPGRSEVAAGAVAKARRAGKVTVHKCLFRLNRFGAVRYLGKAAPAGLKNEVVPSSVASSSPTARAPPSQQGAPSTPRPADDTQVLFSKNTFYGTQGAPAREDRIAGIRVTVRDNTVIDAGGFRSRN